jgi:hypothetical protein
MVRKVTFSRELLAVHRKLIQPYMSSHDQAKCSQVVNTPLLIGYFETSLGLGEYARGLASALEAVAVDDIGEGLRRHRFRGDADGWRFCLGRAAVVIRWSTGEWRGLLLRKAGD